MPSGSPTAQTAKAGQEALMPYVTGSIQSLKLCDLDTKSVTSLQMFIKMIKNDF